jgi:hypothetical protein
MPFVLILIGTAGSGGLAYRGWPVKATVSGTNIDVAVKAARVYVDCTPRRVQLAFPSRRGGV